jgi:hypothetical protein
MRLRKCMNGTYQFIIDSFLDAINMQLLLDNIQIIGDLDDGVDHRTQVLQLGQLFVVRQVTGLLRFEVNDLPTVVVEEKINK